MLRLRLRYVACLCAVLLGSVLTQHPLRAANAPLSGAALEAAIAGYKLKLEEYTRARMAYEDEARSYWTSVAEKRRARNEKRRSQQPILLADYVLTQPPVYSGPPEPINPVPAPPGPPPPKRVIPVVADFLQAALEQFDFKPQLPQSEIEYKRAYAMVAAAAGLTKEQAVRIYGFESGGNGRYDVQAGLEYPRPNAQAISTALGYNQLLSTNTVELLAEQGDRFIAALAAKAAAAGPRKPQLDSKLAVLKRMVAVSQSVPDDWGEHERLGKTPQGLAIHALNLDIDIGPLLQTQKLLDSVEFARRKGYARPLTAAELEMMNLTGDGNGFDMVSMPDDLRSQVPTANFFQPDGYAANRVAIVNDTVAKLLKATDLKMDKEAQLPGARDLASAFP
jgi:hypothetical protein